MSTEELAKRWGCSEDEATERALQAGIRHKIEGSLLGLVYLKMGKVWRVQLIEPDELAGVLVAVADSLDDFNRCLEEFEGIGHFRYTAKRDTPFFPDLVVWDKARWCNERIEDIYPELAGYLERKR